MGRWPSPPAVAAAITGGPCPHRSAWAGHLARRASCPVARSGNAGAPAPELVMKNWHGIVQLHPASRCQPYPEGVFAATRSLAAETCGHVLPVGTWCIHLRALASRGRYTGSAHAIPLGTARRAARHEHLEAFLRAAVEAGDGVGLPQFVEREFREFLECGVFD